MDQIRIIKLINGDDIVCSLAPEQLPAKSPLLRLIKPLQIKYVSQLPSRTPTFAFFANHPKYIGESYKHFLENQLRKHFPLKGVPISVVFREK
jgi:predicted GTPase